MAGLSFSLLFFCSLLSACSFFHKDPVVLQINEQKWTATLFSERLAQKIRSLNIQKQPDPIFINHLKTQLIRDLLMEYIVQKRAKEYSIVVSEQEWQKTLQKIQMSYSSKEVFDLYLERQKIKKTVWEQNLKRTLLHKKVIHHLTREVKKPSDKETKAYYQNHLNIFKEKDSLFIHHAFYKDKEKADHAQETLKRNISEALAKGLELPSLKGEKKWVQKTTFPLFDQAFSLKKKEVSPVWSSSYGYHIIQVWDKKSARLIPYKEALPRVQQILMEQRRKALFTKWLSIEGQKAQVWTDPSLLNKITVSPL